MPLHLTLVVLMAEARRERCKGTHGSKVWAMSVSRETFVRRMGIGRGGLDLSRQLIHNRITEETVDSFMLKLYYLRIVGLDEQIVVNGLQENTRLQHKRTPAA